MISTKVQDLKYLRTQNQVKDKKMRIKTYNIIKMTKQTSLLVAAFLLITTAVFGQTSLSGKITDINGTAVPGATLQVLNSNFGGISNAEGRFTLKNIPAGKYTVQVSALNFATLVRAITVEKQSTEQNFVLTGQGKILDEVVVTAQKSAEKAQDLPLSISSISAGEVQDYKLWNSKDLSGIVPNLYSANPGDNRNVTSIRGITTSSYDPAVATYIDGVNQFNLDTYIAQLQDVERIEVLRGPQGTLYGRNGMGGVINIITRQPANQFRGSVEASYGSFNLQRYNLSISTPLVNNRLFFGASGLYTRQSGFYTNAFTQSAFDNQHSTMGSYFLKYLAGDKLTITLNAKHSANRNMGTFPLAGSFPDALKEPFVLNQNNVAQLVDNVVNSSLSVNYSGRNFNFTSQSSYQSNYRFYKGAVDADFSPIDGYSIVNDFGHKYNKVQVATQEFRFSSAATAASPLKWIAGTYMFYQDSPNKQGTHIGSDAPLLGMPFGDFTSININRARGIGAAVFGQGTYAIDSKLDLIAGIRYDYERKKQHIEGQFQPDGASPMVTRSDTSSTASFHAFSPKAGLQFHVTERSNFYGTYSRGFRAGGISQLSADPREALIAYKPEYSNNFEIGSKNTFLKQQVRLNLSVFYTTINNAQVPTLVLPEAITVTRNAGKLRSKGAEAELAVRAAKAIEISYNLGFTDAKYTRLNVSSNGAAVNLSNNRQVFTPDMTSMLALQFGHQVSKDVRLVARGEWRYTGEQYFDLANQLKQDPYHLYNARLGVSAKRFSVFVWGANLANKTYVDYAYDFGAAHLGNPRVFGVTTKIGFN